jgi:hypothetical protein
LPQIFLDLLIQVMCNLKYKNWMSWRVKMEMFKD